MINLTTLLRLEPPPAGDLRYGARRAGASRPVVVWTATRRCNLACRHCYSASLDRPYPAELTSREARRFVEDLAAMPAAGLLVSGGEPLLRPDVLDIAHGATALGVMTALSTNGTMLADEAVADAVAQVGFSYVGVSFDGLGAAHDRFRGRAGAFEASVAGVRSLKARGQRAGLRLTLTAATVPQLPQVFEFVEREGFDRACFYHLAPSGRARRAGDETLSHELARAAVDRIIAFADGARASIPDLEVLTVANAADGPRLLGWLAERGRDTAEVRRRLARAGGNRSGIALAHVSNTGEVHPDQFSWTHRLGSIRTRPFSQIWTDADGALGALRDRRPRLEGRCADCRFLDVCGGNLRLRAQVDGEGLWATDPACYLAGAETAA